MNILGIDPGLTGAIAMWDGHNLTIQPIPTVKVTTRGRDVDWGTLNHIWDEHFFWADHAFIERVASRPGQGVASMFKFGMVYGGLRSMAASKLVPSTLVLASKWKKSYSLSAEKEAAVARAIELFPASASLFRGPRGGMLDGIAEAALIARYGYDQIGNES